MRNYFKFVFASLLLLLTVVSFEVVSADSPTPKHEMRAAWISTVFNLDIKPGMDEAEFRNWADTEIKSLEKKNFNTIIFQVKPTADAFYPSELAPWSRYITGQGEGVDPGYDPLQIMIDTAHKYGVELHGWINPYRVTTASQGLDDLTSDNIASKQPDWVVKSGSQHFLDPGIPGVQEYLIETVKELVENYDIDAVHMDDYFYPGTDFEDADTFAEYGGDFTDIGDWRRNNVNELVQNIHTSIKEIKSWVQFGISPSGIWRNKIDDPDGSDTGGNPHYDALYADSQHWIQNSSVDYITPQIYWSRQLAVASYTTLIDWWSQAVDPYPVNLYIGMADYKVNDNFDKAWDNPRELPEQILDNRANGQIQGQMHFRLANIKSNPLDYGDIIQEEVYNYKALAPTLPWNGSSIPNKPENITLQNQPDGVDIAITGPESARKFAIYRFDIQDHIDYTNVNNVIGVVYNKDDVTFTDKAVDPDDSYIYGITSISNTGIESETGFEVDWLYVDKTALEALVNEAKDENETDYTKEAWQALTNELNNAEDVLADEDAMQEDVNTTLEALEDLLTVLKFIDLENLYYDFIDGTHNNYTDESWANVEKELKTTDHLINYVIREHVTQEELNTAYQNLLNAIENLEETPGSKVFKNMLKSIVAKAEGLNAADYADWTFEEMTDTLQEAKDILEDHEATQEEVDLISQDLEYAMFNLLEVEPGDHLRELVDDAEAYDAADYTEESFATLSTALQEAKDVLDNDDATQEEVDAALEALQEAIEALEEVEAVDFSELDALVLEYAETPQGNYTDESWAALESALNAAGVLLAKEDVTQVEVDAAYDTLLDAVENLEEKEAPMPKVNKDELRNLLGEIEAYDPADYTEESYAELLTAINDSSAVLSNDDATQEEVDAALEALQEAIEALEEVKAVDFSELDALVLKYAETPQGNYTDESWAALQSALHAAEVLFSEEDVTQAEVDEAYDDLLDAIENLEEKEPIIPTDPEPKTIEVEFGTEYDVNRNDIVSIQGEGANTTITMPDNLPKDTKVIVTDARNQAEALLDGNLIIAGDMFDISIFGPDNEKVHGPFTLTMSYDKDQYDADEVAIYYYDEEASEWIKQIGMVDGAAGTITVEVDHFSIYGVLSTQEDEEDDKDSDNGIEIEPEDKDSDKDSQGDGDKLPKTSTNTFNIMLIGSIMLLLGSIAFFIYRYRTRLVQNS